MGKKARDSNPGNSQKAQGSRRFGSAEHPPELGYLGRIAPGDVLNPLGNGAPGRRRGFIKSRMPEILELTPTEVERRLRRRKTIPAGEVIALEIVRSGCRGVARAQDQIIAMEPREVVMDVVVAPNLEDRLDALAAELGAQESDAAPRLNGANGSGRGAH